jgi:hypothetical protein
MPMTTHPLCPLCQAVTTRGWIRLETFTARLRPLCALQCCCATAQHTPLLAHPHTREDCVGYLEIPDDEEA